VSITTALRAFLNWMRGLLQTGKEAEPLLDRVPNAAPRQKVGGPDPRQEAQEILQKVQGKVQKLAADFDAGTINRAQFRSLYAHYQRQIQSLETVIEAVPATEEWKGDVVEGQSVFIRREHIARARGYAIFENESGMPLSTLGRFELDPALLVPMLASYRSAAREAFGAGTRSTEMEDGRWLCYVPGEYTTMLAVFSTEPASKQLQFLEQLHLQFEQANHRLLSGLPADTSELLFPHEYYLGQWRR
jgi:hypothetical protein